MSARPRQLGCACCGGDAGRWLQWFNQDTGYGLCGPCGHWIASRGMSPDDMDRTYGREGEHRAPAAPREAST